MSRPLPRSVAPAIAPFVEHTRRGIVVRVRVTPGARADRIEGIAADVDGRLRVRVAVRAAADRGQANAAVVALLAREWGLAKSTLAIVAGASDRRKTIAVVGDPAVVADELARWASRRSFV